MNERINLINSVKIGMIIGYYDYSSNQFKYFEVIDITNQDNKKKVHLKGISAYDLESIEPLSNKEIFKAYTKGRIEGCSAFDNIGEYQRECKVIVKKYKAATIITEANDYEAPSRNCYWKRVDFVKSIPTRIMDVISQGVEDTENA